MNDRGLLGERIALAVSRLRPWCLAATAARFFLCTLCHRAPHVSCPPQGRELLFTLREKYPVPGVTSRSIMATIGENYVVGILSLRSTTVIASRRFAWLSTAIAGSVLLAPMHAQAQWWSARAPIDFEECADRAEKAATKEAKTSALSECHSKFAGRRKPGGGYTYFDFMQNRHFDIAGPNPTPEEQKHIDEQYIAYLEQERRATIAAAFTAQQQQQQVQQVTFKSEIEKVPVPRESPVKQQAANDLRARTKASNCTKNSFSCEWPRLSEGINELKKLFGSSQGSSQGKAKRS
jgi:hypothetical protein